MPTALPMREVEGYCVREKAPRKMIEVRYIRTSTGRLAATGRCPVCGSAMFKFVRAEDVPPGVVIGGSPSGGSPAS